MVTFLVVHFGPHPEISYLMTITVHRWRERIRELWPMFKLFVRMSSLTEVKIGDRYDETRCTNISGSGLLQIVFSLSEYSINEAIIIIASWFAWFFSSFMTWIELRWIAFVLLSCINSKSWVWLREFSFAKVRWVGISLLELAWTAWGWFSWLSLDFN